MVVAEAYLHFERLSRPSPLRSVGESAFPIVEQAAREFLTRFEYQRLAEVVVEEGSLRLRGRIRVTAGALLTAFIGYGAVRQSIDYARRDGKTAAGWINDHLREMLSLSGTDVIARRRFAPAPTRLRTLFDSVEAGQLTAAAAAAEAEKLFRAYGEDSRTIQRVVDALRAELADVQPVDAPSDRSRKRRVDKSPVAILRGKRISVFRDRAGSVRVVED
jgi:hypothetical protein